MQSILIITAMAGLFQFAAPAQSGRSRYHCEKPQQLNGNGTGVAPQVARVGTQQVNGHFEIPGLFIKAADSDHAHTSHEEVFIKFKLRNNSLLPRKVSVIYYRPDETGNGTNAFVMIPYGTKRYEFPIGTKIYLASQQQVNTVMSGRIISDQPPFLTITRECNHKTFNINN